MITVEALLKDFNIQAHKNGSGSHYILDKCPSCSGKNKFYINAENGKFICHKCSSNPDSESKGGIVKLAMLLGSISRQEAIKKVYNRSLMKEERDRLFSADQLSKIISSMSGENDDDEHSFEYPTSLVKLKSSDSHPAIDYLRSRGLTDEDMDKCGIHVCEHEERNLNFKEFLEDGFSREEATFWSSMTGRVMFSVRQNLKIVGFVARAYTKGLKPKVLNTKGDFRNQTIWNLDFVKSSKEVVIAEGIISAVKCGIHRSVATFGIVITEYQIFELMKLHQDTKIVLCVDPGAEPEAHQNFKRLKAWFTDVRILKLPKELAANGEDYKDAGDYTHAEMDAKIRLMGRS